MTTLAPRFAAAFSASGDALDACRQVKADLGAPVDLAFAFVSSRHRDDMPELADVLYAELDTECLLGCTAESLACNGREYEDPGGLAVWGAHLPGVSVTPMHLEFESTPEGGAFVGWPDDLPEPWPEGSALVMLGEPLSFPADVLLAQLNEGQPGACVVGGMASGGWRPGENRRLLGAKGIETGAVAVLIHGPIRIRTVVSQGCRPIGQPLVVTKAERNVIQELGGRPALAQLQQQFQALTPHEQRLAQKGLHVGQVIDEYRQTFSRGDFLVRNVQGAEADTGAIAIGDWARVGQTVQFHVRDAATADEDLNELLAAAREQSPGGFGGGLLFTCNGRGTRLFDEPHHDAAALARLCGQLPVAGFFAQGEIGPVGGKNFLHGFTASIALFERPSG
jgi:small ligand-binding sensory domain FIST